MDDEMKAFVDRVRQHYDAIPAVPVKDITIDDVYALFSADTIQAQSKARGIVTSANGKTYIVTGAYWHGNDDRYILGHECIPVAAREAHHPQPQTYEERNVEKNWGEGFYNGMIVKCKGVEWIMLGRDVRFVEEAQTREKQMKLF